MGLHLSLGQMLDPCLRQPTVELLFWDLYSLAYYTNLVSLDTWRLIKQQLPFTTPAFS